MEAQGAHLCLSWGLVQAETKTLRPLITCLQLLAALSTGWGAPVCCGLGERVPQGLGEAGGPRLRAYTPPPAGVKVGHVSSKSTGPSPHPDCAWCPGPACPQPSPVQTRVRVGNLHVDLRASVVHTVENIYQRETQGN